MILSFFPGSSMSESSRREERVHGGVGLGQL